MNVRLIFVYTILILVSTNCGWDSNPAVPTSEPLDIHALQLNTLNQTWSTINENYVYDDFGGIDWLSIKDEYQSKINRGLTPEEFESVMRNMLEELPPGTASLESRVQRIDNAFQRRDTYQGIGAFVAGYNKPEARIALLSVMAGSPAEKAGLQAHDALLAIDGVPIQAGEETSEVNRVRGPAGSDVSLTVRSPGEEPREVVVTRDAIQRTIQRLNWKMWPGTNVGYFLFPSVPYDELDQDFLIGLESLSAVDDLEAIILDLRIVSGDTNWPVSILLTVFTNGTIGTFYSRNQSQDSTIEGVGEIADSQNIPLALLIGPNTTGAAEIFAAILQASDRAITIGMPTPGELESTTTYYLPNGSLLYLATSSFRTIDGRQVGLLGVEPDVPINIYWDQVTADEDDVIDAALQALMEIN